jgi:hypothetical protein
VLHYLARYTHRVAISNHRLVSLAEGKVTFRWKDYAHGNKKRLMTLTADRRQLSSPHPYPSGHPGQQFLRLDVPALWRTDDRDREVHYSATCGVHEAGRHCRYLLT